MSADAPYWGELPPPQVGRTHSLKREVGNSHLSVDTKMAGDRSSKQSNAPSQRKQDRYSSQTEAATVSTQSPFASPLASEFSGGLAPRPPSFIGGISEDQYNKDYLEKRRRRQQARDLENANAPSPVPPPAAPDAPRAPPPVSYKDPYSNGGSAVYQGPTRSRSGRRSSGPISPSSLGPEEYYRSHPQEGQDTASKDNSHSRNAELGEEAPQPIHRRSRRTRSEQIDTQPRKESLSQIDALRRAEWAPDRSPLQRLELTLDSITKEEKRARVEEAELIARENEANRGPERGNKNSVRFRNRPVAKGPENITPPEPRNISQGDLSRRPSPKPKDQPQGSTSNQRNRQVEPGPSTSRNLDPGFEYQEKQEPSPVAPQPEQTTPQTTPQRGKSFRDRSRIPVPISSIKTTAALGRSGSNRLRKDPPVDLSRRQVEADAEYSQKSPQESLNTNRQQDYTAASGPSRAATLRNQNQVSNTPPSNRDFDSSDEIDARPRRRGTLSKAERMTGETLPAQTARSFGSGKDTRNQVVTVNGVQYAVTPKPGESSDTRDVTNRGPPGHQDHHHLKNLLHLKNEAPNNDGIYASSRRLDEWKKGGVALLAGTLLDLNIKDNQTEAEKDKAWWEAGHTSTRRRSSTGRRKAEAYDGEYDNNAPTRFKPPLFLKAGPLLRYCGLRKEPRGRTSATDREIWRGSIMIVTQDGQSSYELAPTLRLFLQPMDLLPPPPSQVDGEIEDLAPEYIDPLAGLPKLGRDGRTLYVRPVDHLEEGIDLSKEESDEGLYEMHRSSVDGAADKRSQNQKASYDGEKAGKYKEVRGFRLHAEQGVTFWRFNIEIELRDKQQRIAYRINRGPATGFWVPARDQAMSIMFYSCNGFSYGTNPNSFCGPDPLWRDVMNTHQTQPFHVMLGGGDQIYNDAVMYETQLYKDWWNIKDDHHKEKCPFTPDMQSELEAFYLNRYCMWFSQGLFSLAVSQIPMINIFDDHDIIDGFGSYNDDFMRSPVFSGLGAIAFKYYMLFQHQSSIDEGEENEPSWILGTQPGPYIKELSRSVFAQLGRSVAFVGLDCRTERMNDEILSAETYYKIFSRLEKELIKGETKHLIVMVGIPVAYPRMVWLENILTSRAIEPIKFLGRAGLLGKNLLNHMDGGVEILDDLDDHWTAKHHKDERNWFLQELQDLAAEKSVRITILGGDVHLGAIGQFYSKAKLGIPKDKDFRYMPNVISSAIVNTPPPDTLADILNRRNKIHHLDAETDEDMIPIFTRDVNGKPRHNKRLLNRRNWCSIRIYDPELTPPQTPQTDGTVTPPPKRGFFRRLSSSRGPAYRPDAAPRDPGPPISSASFFAKQGSTPQRRGSMDSGRPGSIRSTFSLKRAGSIFRRKNKKPDSGGINGYGAESESEEEQEQQYFSDPQVHRSGIRGGSGGSRDHENSYFPEMESPMGRAPENPVHKASTSIAGSAPRPGVIRKEFRRTPTGLTQKQLKKGGDQTINLEGGLDICLNMEVNPKDPAGITMPYRLLVPALWYDEEPKVNVSKSGTKRWSLLGGGGHGKENEREMIEGGMI